ncbi:serine carboxypeptidase-like [Coffea arabica]|uniref:Carboxypeptidase n=1 Tax=Coffea arabica TaxID=13443 RepID=A0ABM4WLU8_COFAR
MANALLPLLLLCILLLGPATFSARIGNHQKALPHLVPKFRVSPAKGLIRGLNLHPRQGVNIVANDFAAANDSRIVEKPLKLNILGAPDPSVADLGHHAGYFNLPHTVGARMFYFFFESRRKNNSDPVVIWLTGGPGCSSELALFYENGPFHITDGLSLVWNNFGWDKISNIIFVDQPTGTGFSYSSSNDDIRHDEKGVSNDLYDFLQAFFRKHPEYAKNEFYITGESYAGHYVPALAGRVNQGNKNKEGILINLKGFAIGNGLTNPLIQYKGLPDYALEHKLISQSYYNGMQESVTECEEAIEACGTSGTDSCETAYELGNEIFDDILSSAGNINYYDIRKQCEGQLCYDFSNVENFLNQDTVREALGVGHIEWVSCSSTVYDAMVDDWMRNIEVDVPALLEDGIKLLVYAGEYDLVCNWLGNSRWVQAMEWSGQKAYLAAPNTSFTTNGVEAGVRKGYGPLTFLKVLNAGHMVPMDQPQAALEMLESWIKGKL